MAEPARSCGVVDCRPPAAPPAPPAVPRVAQAVDYMAKDYDSLLRGMLDLLPARVPEWKDRTEADLGMALLELFAYVGDQLSYYQDRVANEAFLRSAVHPDSVRRLLRLIDYRPDPGVAARVHLAIRTDSPRYLPAGFAVRTAAAPGEEPVVFELEHDRVVYDELNEVPLAEDAPSGPAGDRLILAASLEPDRLPVGAWLYVRTGQGGEWARIAVPVEIDTAADTTTVTLDAPLSGSYPVADAVVWGNGVPATHGVSRRRTADGTGEPDQAVPLDFAPLTYTEGGDGAPRSTLRVEVDGEAWVEVEDFIDSGPADPHYRVSHDAGGYITIRFGGRDRGRTPAAGARIEAAYRTGIGEAGRVRAHALTAFDDPDGVITRVTNPEPSLGARDPQPLGEAKLLGPARVHTQGRAVVPGDYERALLDGVALGGRRVAPLHARARFEWTGSWTTTVVSLELPGRRPLREHPGLREAFEAALADRRLVGGDVRVEDARYAPLHISLVVHVRPEFFTRHVRAAVEAVLGVGSAPAAEAGFFAPGRLGFGDDVYLSDLYAVVMAVEGVAALEVTRFKRLGDRYPDREREGFVPIGPLEIACCANDPAAAHEGILYVRTCGGKEG